MATVPTPVAPQTGVREMPLRHFRSPYWESFCHNCTWVSFMYVTRVEAEDIAEFHADMCTRRINEELALLVEVVPIEAQHLEIGHRVLLRDLRTMDIENISLVDNTVLITYSIGNLQSQLMDLGLDHIVKVVG